MNGNEQHQLQIYLGEHHVAEIGLSNEQMYWRYQSDWQQHGFALSPYLPLVGTISPVAIQKFIRNLLPEGGGLELVSRVLQISQYHFFALARALGADLPGAIRLTEMHQPPLVQATFRPITISEMVDRLAEYDTYHLLVWDDRPRLSVAGVQDKINVVVNEEGQLGLGEGRLCSTHILKFERQPRSYLVLNEFLTMRLAKLCGLKVAEVELVRFEKYSALLVTRFDRLYIDSQTVKRRHVIDGCQALNLSPDEKYERNFGSGRDVAHIREGASLPKLFVFTEQCAEPAKTKQTLLRWVLFNLAAFNFDAHGKNVSFFVGQQGIQLAPFYDLVNIAMYPEFEHEMAMALGDEFDGHMVHAYQLADFADSCSLSRAFVTKQLTMLFEKIQHSLPTLVQLVSLSEQEQVFLQSYCQKVDERCQYLKQQAMMVSEIKL